MVLPCDPKLNDHSSLLIGLKVFIFETFLIEEFHSKIFLKQLSIIL